MLLALLSSLLSAVPSPAITEAAKVPPAEVREKYGWFLWEQPPKMGYTAQWLARRYGVAAPLLERQFFGANAANIDVFYLREENPTDARKLWDGLEGDLAPNQSLGRKGDVIVWAITENGFERERVFENLKPERRGRAPDDLNWLQEELSQDIAGRVPTHAFFLPDLAALEQRVHDCCSVRAVYQTSGYVRDFGRVRGIAQADFWVPRRKGELGALVRKLDEVKTPEHTILSGKGVAIVLTTRSDLASQTLVGTLQKQGYRLESRVATFPSPAPRRPPSPSPPTP